MPTLAAGLCLAAVPPRSRAGRPSRPSTRTTPTPSRRPTQRARAIGARTPTSRRSTRTWRSHAGSTRNESKPNPSPRPQRVSPVWQTLPNSHSGNGSRQSEEDPLYCSRSALVDLALLFAPTAGQQPDTPLAERQSHSKSRAVNSGDGQGTGDVASAARAHDPSWSDFLPSRRGRGTPSWSSSAAGSAFADPAAPGVERHPNPVGSRRRWSQAFPPRDGRRRPLPHRRREPGEQRERTP
jgi:hypothetical protein